MAESVILAVPQIEENQNNKHLTHNDAVDFLEQATQRKLVNAAVGAGPWTLTEDQFTRNVYFKASGASAAFDIVTPGETNTVNNTERLYAVANYDATDTATLKTNGSGTTVSIPPLTVVIVQQSHDDIELIASFALSPAYDVGFFIDGLPGDGADLLKFVFTRAVNFADDFVGSTYHNGANPSATAVFDIKKNNSSIGSISVNTSGVATFSTSGGATSFVAGDRLHVNAPTPQDGTLSDVSISFRGVRIG